MYEEYLRWKLAQDDDPIGISKLLIAKMDKFKKEATMKKCVADVYEKTADAVLVDKWGVQMDIASGADTFAVYLFMKDHKTEILAEAQRLEEESKKY